VASAHVDLARVWPINDATVHTGTHGPLVDDVSAPLWPLSTNQVDDTLIVDEACFVSEEVRQAARFTTIAFTTIARPDSRVILASTPWGHQNRILR
jgi:hypothetical protein